MFGATMRAKAVTVCQLVRETEDGTPDVWFGTAWCSLKDQFCKERGRKIALARALQHEPDRDWRREVWKRGTSPVRVERYSPLGLWNPRADTRPWRDHLPRWRMETLVMKERPKAYGPGQFFHAYQPCSCGDPHCWCEDDADPYEHDWWMK